MGQVTAASLVQLPAMLDLLNRPQGNLRVLNLIPVIEFNSEVQFPGSFEASCPNGRSRIQ